MAISFRSSILFAALLCGASAKAADQGEQSLHDDIAFLQTKMEPLTNSAILTASEKVNELQAKVSRTDESQPILFDMAHRGADAFFEPQVQQDIQNNMSNVEEQLKGLDSPDEKEEDHARELLSVNASSIAKSECPSQPQGWHGCAWGGGIPVPAFCGSSNRHTLNGGTPLTYQQCAFLVAQRPSLCESRWFYTSSTSTSSTGVCKCCVNNGPYYGSSSCNWVYLASSSCQIPR